MVWVMNGLGAQEAIPIARSLEGWATHVVTPRGLDGRDAPALAMSDVAQEVRDAVATLPVDARLIISGFSTAAHHALVGATAVAAAGRRVDLLVLLDPPSNRTVWGSPRSWRRRQQVERAGLRGRRRLRRLRDRDYDLSATNFALFSARQRETFRVALPDYAGPTLVVRTDELKQRRDPAHLTGHVIERTVDGSHLDLIAKGRHVADLISDALDEAGQMTRSLPPSTGT
jgi:hypothetical protein